MENLQQRVGSEHLDRKRLSLVEGIKSEIKIAKKELKGKLFASVPEIAPVLNDFEAFVSSPVTNQDLEFLREIADLLTELSAIHEEWTSIFKTDTRYLGQVNARAKRWFGEASRLTLALMLAQKQKTESASQKDEASFAGIAESL